MEIIRIIRDPTVLRCKKITNTHIDEKLNKFKNPIDFVFLQ